MIIHLSDKFFCLLSLHPDLYENLNQGTYSYGSIRDPTLWACCVSGFNMTASVKVISSIELSPTLFW